MCICSKTLYKIFCKDHHFYLCICVDPAKRSADATYFAPPIGERTYSKPSVVSPTEGGGKEEGRRSAMLLRPREDVARKISAHDEADGEIKVEMRDPEEGSFLLQQVRPHTGFSLVHCNNTDL